MYNFGAKLFSRKKRSILSFKCVSRKVLTLMQCYVCNFLLDRFPPKNGFLLKELNEQKKFSFFSSQVLKAKCNRQEQQNAHNNIISNIQNLFLFASLHHFQKHKNNKSKNNRNCNFHKMQPLHFS